MSRNCNPQCDRSSASLVKHLASTLAKYTGNHVWIDAINSKIVPIAEITFHSVTEVVLALC